MYIIDNIAYAGEQKKPLSVTGVRPLDGNRLWVRFNSCDSRVFDFTPLLASPAFTPLSDPNVFKNVYIDFGVPVWNDGDIDISPDYLYEHGLKV